jgi:hypothetical protein
MLHAAASKGEQFPDQSSADAERPEIQTMRGGLWTA